MSASHRLFAPLVALTLASCATVPDYNEVLKAYEGRAEIDLLRDWGAPSSSYQSDGSKFLTYQSQRNVLVPGVAPVMTTTFVGNTGFTTTTGGIPPRTVGEWCTTTFEVREGRVVNSRWQGNDCRKR